ncbi:hypothetical protein ALC57_18528, partial [Trachymyrmex cornetzi]
EEQLHLGGNRIEKLSYISKFTHNKFTAAVESGFIVHDIDLPRWALFDKSSTICDIESCSNIAVVKCSWCKKSLCLKHFFVEYHYCNEYNE